MMCFPLRVCVGEIPHTLLWSPWKDKKWHRNLVHAWEGNWKVSASEVRMQEDILDSPNVRGVWLVSKISVGTSNALLPLQIKVIWPSLNFWMHMSTCPTFQCSFKQFFIMLFTWCCSLLNCIVWMWVNVEWWSQGPQFHQSVPLAVYHHQ